MQATVTEKKPSIIGGITNVASVPQRSPFRYPGGKTWLVPRLRQWLDSLPVKPQEFIEPFAGGGIASLTTAFEDRAEQVIMVERDEQVAAVWRVILEQPDGGQWLADRIVTFEMTPEIVRQVLCAPCSTLREVAFRTILKNRISHGGILAPGAGTLKHGENGKGISSRWYPETLRKRILDIAEQRHCLQFTEGDGMQILRNNANQTDAVFFIDPPYTTVGQGKRAGTRLYTYNELDHEELFQIASTLNGEFLMTYDNVPAVIELAKKFGFETRAVAMKNTHHAKMSELLIGRNLDWMN